jgi:hypothetical protein
MIATLRRAFAPPEPYPPEHRRNFLLLFLDVTFWGILNGSTITFLGVYASRIGASPIQVGILTASPAFINILFSFSASNFSRGKSHYQITRWAWLTTRIFYAMLIPIPLLLADSIQIWVIIAITLAMNVPGTLAAVIGNSFFAETVPLRYRGSVVGTRNALLAATSMLTAFVIGQISEVLPLAQQYSVVFSIGFVGSMISVLMLFLIRPVQDSRPAISKVEVHAATARNKGIRLEILRGPFGRVALTTFIFHIAVFWANPIVPLYQTRSLNFTDLVISQGTSIFWIMYFLASTQSSRLAARWGFRRLLGVGALGSGFALLIFTYSYQSWIYLVCQIISGVGWAWIGSGLINYVLEQTPADDRPAHLAWYNTIVNSAVLICGLIVPLSENITGLFGGMLLGTLLRFLAALVILL